MALARRLGVPTRWTEGRTENGHATIQGRGQVQHIELAADADGKVTAVRVKLLADMGAYLQLVTPGIPLLGAFLYHGVYDVPAYHFECTGVFTTCTPTDAYRGAGRPEATYAIERAMDALARQVGVDARRDPPPQLHRPRQVPLRVDRRADLRLRRLRAHARPGAGAGRLRRPAGRAAAPPARRARPSHLGIGVATYVEMCGLAPSRVLASLQLRRRRLGGRHRARCCPPARCRWSAARRPTARATRPRGRRSWPTVWASTPTTSRCCTPTPPSVPHRHGHLRQPLAAGRRGGGGDGHRQGASPRPGPSPPISSSARRTTSSSSTGELRVRGTPTKVDDAAGRGVRSLQRPRPARRRRAQPHGPGHLRPAQLRVPVRDARGRGRDRRGDRPYRAGRLRRGRRLRPAGQPA